MKRSDYLAQFTGAKSATGRQEEALKQALDIRKFEIDTYWKRAAYFWACIAVAYAGFFALSATPHRFEIALVASLGSLFSVGWYLVNRGSSSWQANWEAQVDLLEDESMGPLYKSHVNRDRHDIFDMAGPYAFSPSRVNTLLSFIVLVSWVILLARALYGMSSVANERCTALLIGLSTAVAAIVLIWNGRSGDRQGTVDFDVRTRNYP